MLECVYVALREAYARQAYQRRCCFLEHAAIPLAVVADARAPSRYLIYQKLSR